MPRTVLSISSGPENISFLSFLSKGLKIKEKNEGVPLVFVDREQPQWEHLPLACSPQPGHKTSVFPTLQPQTRALQTPSGSLVSIALGLRWDPRSPPHSLPHFLDPVGQPKLSGV